MEGSLVVIVVDCSLGWAAEGQARTLLDTFDGLQLLVRTVLALRAGNRVAVVAAHPSGSALILEEPEDDLRRQGAAAVALAVVERVRHHMTEKNATGPLDQVLLVAGMSAALSVAACYIQRLMRVKKKRLVPRVLVVSRTPDDPLSYVSMMNALFALERQQVMLDALAVMSSSSYLNQGASLTGGLYMECETDMAAILMEYFSLDKETRSFVDMPKPKLVDSRASCFCHGRPVDLGSVCSICLAIYCKRLPVCQVCGSKFELEKLPASSSSEHL